MSTEIKELLVNPIDFNIENFVIDEPKKSKKDQSKTAFSNVFYKDEDGANCILVMPLPQQSCFVGYKHNFKLAEEDKTPENAEGIQVSYSLTAFNNTKGPSEDEEAVGNVFDSIQKCIFDFGNELLEKEEDTPEEEKVLAGTVSASFFMAQKKKNPSHAVKPVFDYPSKKGGGKDTSKPKRSYIQFITQGKGAKMICKTNLFGSGGKRKNYLNFINKPCLVQPVVMITSIYWGGHGEATYGASLRFHIGEANISVSSGGAGRTLTKSYIKPLPASENDQDSDEDKPPQRSNGKEEVEEEGLFKPSNDLDKMKAIVKNKVKGSPRDEDSAPKKSKVALQSKAPEPKVKSQSDSEVKPKKGKVIPEVENDDDSNIEASQSEEEEKPKIVKNAKKVSSKSKEEVKPAPKVAKKEAPIQKKVAKKAPKEEVEEEEIQEDE